MTGKATYATAGRFAHLLAVLLASAPAGRAHATEWSIAPQLGLLVNYNDNLLLTPSDERASAGTTLSLDAVFKAATERTEWDLHPHLDFLRYSDTPEFNAADGSLQGSYATHGELSSVSITGGYESASTLTTELTDTGIVDGSIQRKSATAGLNVSRTFSERQQLALQTSYADVEYPGGASLGLVGYHYPSVSLTDTFATSALGSLSGSVFADWLRVPLTGYTSNDRGLRVALARTFSVRTSVSASVGVTETTVQGYTQHGSVWDLHATRTGERSQWELDYSQTVQPSGRGYLVRRDQASINLSRSITEQLSARLVVVNLHNRNLSNGPFYDVPWYVAVELGLEWRLSPQWVLSFTAGAIETREATTDELARGWHTGINAVWTPHPRTLSR